MGTGVGEAMLIGAMTGAGTSAITGNDPIKGALLGAAGGGLGAGLGGVLAGGGSGAAAGTTAGTAGAAGGAGAGTAGAAGGAGAGTAGGAAGASAVPSAFNTAVSAATPGAGTIPLGSAGNVGMTTSGFGNTIGTAAAPTSVAGLPSATATAPATATATAPSGMKFMDVFKGDAGSFGSRLGTYMQENPKTTAAVGATLANMAGQKRPGLPGEDPYSGPLSRFRYDPDRYRPAFAGGGIADLPISRDYASGGISDLGSYSDGGRLLKGPGDGMSDSIPAKIGRRQPARLADGEFVVPADVVSHLGNGSTDAGAKQLYAMMDKVRRERTGSKKQGKQINPRKFVPA